MNLSNISEKINNAATAYDAKFRADHADRDSLDFGTCGSAVVLISFGRKRKIKEACLEAGLITNRTWDSCGKKCFVANIPTPTVPTQYVGYYSNRAYAIADVISEALSESGVEVTVHSWVD